MPLSAKSLNATSTFRSVSDGIRIAGQREYEQSRFAFRSAAFAEPRSPKLISVRNAAASCRKPPQAAASRCKLLQANKGAHL